MILVSWAKAIEVRGSKRMLSLSRFKVAHFNMRKRFKLHADWFTLRFYLRAGKSPLLETISLVS